MCNCKAITAGEIEDAILADRLIRVEEIVERTHAGSGCGGCAPRIGAILANFEAQAALSQAVR
nr:(2Fe-2S)-binding protein [Telmatospirillum siberiense]